MIPKKYKQVIDKLLVKEKSKGNTYAYVFDDAENDVYEIILSPMTAIAYIREEDGMVSLNAGYDQFYSMKVNVQHCFEYLDACTNNNKE